MMSTPAPNRFTQVTEDEIQQLVSGSASASTNHATSMAMNCLRAYIMYMSSTSLEVDFSKVSKTELANLLRRFYVCIRNKSGEHYKRNSFNSIKFGLARYMKATNGYDIVNDAEFTAANEAFKAQLTLLKKEGKASIDHHSEIEPEDLQTLYTAVSKQMHTPRGLQRKVWLDVMIHLIRRGRENLRKMTKTTYAVDIDATGRRFVYQAIDEMDKNHRENQSPTETTGDGRIYEIPGSALCPVSSFERYHSKLHPDIESLWQKPKDSAQPSDTIWYCKMVVGERTLGNMMSQMSEKYKLSRRFTNHCLRVTAISILDQSGVAGRHIIRISGHKNEESLKNYSRKVTNDKKAVHFGNYQCCSQRGSIWVQGSVHSAAWCCTIPVPTHETVKAHLQERQTPLETLRSVPGDNIQSDCDDLGLSNSQMDSALSSLMDTTPDFSLSPTLSLVDDYSHGQVSDGTAVRVAGESALTPGLQNWDVQHHEQQSSLNFQQLREEFGINFHPSMNSCPVNINFNYNT